MRVKFEATDTTGKVHKRSSISHVYSRCVVIHFAAKIVVASPTAMHTPPIAAARARNPRAGPARSLAPGADQARRLRTGDLGGQPPPPPRSLRRDHDVALD